MHAPVSEPHISDCHWVATEQRNPKACKTCQTRACCVHLREFVAQRQAYWAEKITQASKSFRFARFCVFRGLSFYAVRQLATPRRVTGLADLRQGRAKASCKHGPCSFCGNALYNSLISGYATVKSAQRHSVRFRRDQRWREQQRWQGDY